MNKYHSKNYREGDTLNENISIYYKGMRWGIAKVIVYFENKVFPPRRNHNYRFIKVKAKYGGKQYIIRCVKGEVEGSIKRIKELIEKDLIIP